MSRLSGVLQQPGPERGEGHQWERSGGGSDLLSAEASGGGKRGAGHGGPGVGPSDRAAEKAGPTWDQRDAVQPDGSQRFLGGRARGSSLTLQLYATQSRPFQSRLLSGLKLQFHGLFCKFQGCHRT